MKISRVILTALIVSGWLLTVAQAPPGRRGADPRTEWQGKDLKVGDRAPDFELPRLDPFLKAASENLSRLAGPGLPCGSGWPDCVHQPLESQWG